MTQVVTPIRDVKGTEPSRRTHASIVYYKRKFYIFGGADEKDRYLNDLYCYDEKKNTWEKLITRGETPETRYFHTAVLYNNVMLVYGGYGCDWDANVHHLDLDTLRWKSTPIKCPPARFSHSAVVYHNKMYVFGGRIDAGWTNELLEYNITHPAWNEVNQKGTAPSARCAHSVSMYNGEYMFIFGGYGSDFKNLNNLYSFHIPTNQWMEVKQSLRIPSPRCNHKTVIIKDHMYLFGGKSGEDENGEIFEFDIKTGTWIGIGKFEKNLIGHAMIDNYPSKQILVFGGSERTELSTLRPTNNLYWIKVLDVDKSRSSLDSLGSESTSVREVDNTPIAGVIEEIINEKKYDEKRKAIIYELLEKEFIDTCGEWKRLSKEQKLKFPSGLVIALDDKLMRK